MNRQLSSAVVPAAAWGHGERPQSRHRLFRCQHPDLVQLLEFAEPRDRIAVDELRDESEALLVRHPDHGDQIGDDEHDVLRHLGPGHRPHAAEHRAEQDAEQTEPDSDLERDVQRTRRDGARRVDLRRHVGERRDDQHEHRAEARRVAAVPRTDEVGHRVAAELAEVRRHERSHQHVSAGPADDEREVGVPAHVDAAGHRDEGRAGHPVRRRRHAVEHRRDGAARHVVGVDLHRARQPADGGVDQDRKCDEQNADGVGTHPHLLEDGHKADEDDEPTRVQSVDLGQVVDEAPLHCHGRSPSVVFGHAAFAVDPVLLPREPEDQHHEYEQ